MESVMREGLPSAAQMLLEQIRSRRSVRRYRRDPIPRAWAMVLLEAARWAPSAHNRQPWRFVMVEDAHMKAQLARAMGERLTADLRQDGVPEERIAEDVARSYERIVSAPLAIVVCLSMQEMDRYPDARRQTAERTMAVQSVAMAGQNILLMAHALGLGACWICAPLFCPEIVQETLGLPADWEPQGMILIGFPAGPPREKPRRPIEAFTRWIEAPA
ncbi:nitroreductase family protein [Thermoflexus sp.]|uniref:nitroreductase family protein n=1 Tax=Thermoflexus sp. TaxID=1969742 RepID=UPI00177731D5|nr:nitroreductase family protein [Thermoflexus sp.]